MAESIVAGNSDDASPMTTADFSGGSTSNPISLSRDNDGGVSPQTLPDSLLKEEASESGESFRLETVSGDTELPILPMDVEGWMGGPSDEGKRKAREMRRRRKAEEAAKPKPLKVTPNAFVAVRVKSSVIRERMERVQQDMVEGDRRLRRLLVSLDKLHITLMVLKLDTPQQIAT